MEYEVALDRVEEFAAQFWKDAADVRLFAFHGPMGAGKTTLIGALCRHKGVMDTISSPTFSIINQYRYVQNGAQQVIYHMDLYRLRDSAEVVQAGVEDCLFSGEVCMVEWPEKAPELFEEGAAHIYIEPVSDSERHLKIVLPTHSIKEQS